MIYMRLLGGVTELEREINSIERNGDLVLVQVIGPSPLSGQYQGLFRSVPTDD